MAPCADEDSDASGSGINDDQCAICNGRGDLLCCDACPRAFHLACCGKAAEGVLYRTACIFRPNAVMPSGIDKSPGHNSATVCNSFSMQGLITVGLQDVPSGSWFCSRCRQTGAQSALLQQQQAVHRPPAQPCHPLPPPQQQQRWGVPPPPAVQHQGWGGHGSRAVR
jgi:hypothetical protein